MKEDHVLAKTTRISMLFDFYAPLLTEKQRTYLAWHFHDDLSLGEIAADSSISRQAVYEHIKRAETTLESYESKLRLLARHEARLQCIRDLRGAVQSSGNAGQESLLKLIGKLEAVDLNA